MISDGEVRLSKLREQWASKGDLGFIRAQLERRGCELSSITASDLGAFDNLHSGLFEATRIFVEWAGITKKARVLDLGLHRRL
jgi:hypothetical protein